MKICIFAQKQEPKIQEIYFPYKPLLLDKEFSAFPFGPKFFPILNFRNVFIPQWRFFKFHLKETSTSESLDGI